VVTADVVRVPDGTFLIAGWVHWSTGFGREKGGERLFWFLVLFFLSFRVKKKVKSSDSWSDLIV
jgi:hypothetical protein